MSTQYQIETKVVEGVEFIMKHLQGALFPRKIMTKKIGYQIEVSNMNSLLKYYKESDYLDCRINAYPIFTEYKGINMTPPGFIMIDLDLRDFGRAKVKLDSALKNTLNKIAEVIHGHPTVLWTGNGYHIYQPMGGFILEEVDVFARFVDPLHQDQNLTTKYMRFAEMFFTNKKSDPQHDPSVNSCLLRIPGSYNSKCTHTSDNNGEVKVIQEWDEKRPAINYLLREFRKFLINEKIRTRIIEARRKKPLKIKRCHLNHGFSKEARIVWIENLIQSPISDHRKYVVWRVLAPYLMNVRKLSEFEAFKIVMDWLNKCNSLKRLNFNQNVLVRYNLRSALKKGYLPISFDKLKCNNKELHLVLNCDTI